MKKFLYELAFIIVYGLIAKFIGFDAYMVVVTAQILYRINDK